MTDATFDLATLLSRCQTGTCKGLGYTLRREGEHAHADLCECVANCPTCNGSRYALAYDDLGYEVAAPCKTCGALVQRVGAFNVAELPSGYGDKTLAGYKVERGASALQQVKTRLLRWQKGFDLERSRGVLLCGPPGTGKTHLMSALCADLTLRWGVACRFVDFYHLTARIRATYDASGDERESDILGALVDVPVLAIDELGKGQGTAWELGIVDQLISRRYNAGRIVLATTNYRPEALTDPSSGEAARESLDERVGARIASRLMEICEVFDVDAPDFRTGWQKGSRQARTGPAASRSLRRGSRG